MAAWTHIAHSALSLPAATVTWTGISGSYDHLYLKMSTRCDAASYQTNIFVNFNSDTGTNYSETQLYAGTATPGSYHASGQTKLQYGAYSTGTSALADTFSSTTMWIPNYANTANFKQALTLNAAENASTATNAWYLYVIAGLWSNQDAIDRITITASSGNFVQYSTFTLYGVSGA